MRLEWKTCLRVAISAFVLYLAIHYWSYVSRALGVLLGAAAPMAVGLGMAYILNIPMCSYERLLLRSKRISRLNDGARRVICLLAALVTVTGLLALVIMLVIPELVDCIRFLLSEIPPAIDRLLQQPWVQELVPQDIISLLDSLDLNQYIRELIDFLRTQLGSAVTTLFSALTSVLSSLVNFCISLIFALYLLMGRDRLQNQCRRLMRHYLPARWEGPLRHYLQVFNESFHRYIVGQCTEAVILGVLCIGGMLIFRLPYAAMIGTLVGFTALIPIAGAYIGGVVGAIMILTVSLPKAIFFVIFLVVLQQLEGNLIYPKVMGKSTGLPALWVLAAITIGGGLMGILGMLLGVPITSALYRLLREDLHRREGVESAAETTPDVPANPTEPTAP